MTRARGRTTRATRRCGACGGRTTGIPSSSRRSSRRSSTPRSKAFGVGTWQARTVPVASGLAAVVLLMMGLSARGRPPGGARSAALLLATEYTWVMWNRAALMESTMTAFMVAAWAAYALAARTSGVGLRRRDRGRAGLVHEGRRGVLRGRDRARRGGRHSRRRTAGPASASRPRRAASDSEPEPRCSRSPAWRRGRRRDRAGLRAGRTGPSTGSTTCR